MEINVPKRLNLGVKKKNLVNVCLSPEAYARFAKICDDKGVTKASVLRILVEKVCETEITF